MAREVIAVADELGATPAQVAIAWVRAQPWHLIPIVGARTESQLRENLGDRRRAAPEQWTVSTRSASSGCSHASSSPTTSAS